MPKDSKSKIMHKTKKDKNTQENIDNYIDEEIIMDFLMIYL